MRAEVRDLWVEALESGRFKQGQDVLHRKQGTLTADTFCCLGVLCEVAIERGVDIERKPSGRNYNYGDVTGGSSETDLPPAVAAWAGCDSNPTVAIDPAPLSAITANDQKKWSFAEIAASLRKMPAENI